VPAGPLPARSPPLLWSGAAQSDARLGSFPPCRRQIGEGFPRTPATGRAMVVFIRPVPDAPSLARQPSRPPPKSYRADLAPSVVGRPCTSDRIWGHNRTSRSGSASCPGSTCPGLSLPACDIPRHSLCIYSHRCGQTSADDLGIGRSRAPQQHLAKVEEAEPRSRVGSIPTTCWFCRTRRAPSVHRQLGETLRTPRRRTEKDACGTRPSQLQSRTRGSRLRSPPQGLDSSPGSYDSSHRTTG
jgi:hypothetical protein